MSKKKASFYLEHKNYSGRVRFFSISYFLNTHYNMSVQDFIFFCESVGKYHGSMATLILLMERTVPVFVSNHLMINTCSGVRVNNTTFEPMSGHRGPFLAVGDILEFGCIVKQNCSSIFSPLFVIIFNIILTSRSYFFRTRLMSTVIYICRFFLFRRKKILRALRRRKVRIPKVRRALLGNYKGVNYNSVSYFIRSRATSNIHMLNAAATEEKKRGNKSIGSLEFVHFVQTVVRTNKVYVVGFLESFGMNGF